MPFRESSTAGIAYVLLLALVITAAIFGARWHAKHPGLLARRARTLWARLGKDWSVHAYLATHLAIGLVVSVLAVWGFAALADAVVEREAITQFDIAMANRLHASATPFGIRVWRLLSDIGSPIAMTVLMIVVAIALWRRREHVLMTTWLLGFIGGSILDQALKFVFQRPRPSFATPIIVARGFSFPSGHAMGSLIGYGLLAYLSWRATRRRPFRVAIIIAASALIIGIGLSRLYLGAHYFSDVVAGYAAGIVWLSVCISGAELTAGHK